MFSLSFPPHQEPDASQRSFQDLQRQYSDTRQQLELMQLQAEDEKERHSLAIQKLREEMRALHNRHRQQLVHEDLEHKVNSIRWSYNRFYAINC